MFRQSRKQAINIQTLAYKSHLLSTVQSQLSQISHTIYKTHQLITQLSNLLRITPQSQNNMIIHKYTSPATLPKSLIIQIAINISSMSTKARPQPFTHSKAVGELIEIEQQKSGSLSLFEELLEDNYCPGSQSSNFCVQNSETIASKPSFDIREGNLMIRHGEVFFNQPTKMDDEHFDKLKEESDSEDSLNNHTNHTGHQCEIKQFPQFLRQRRFEVKIGRISGQHKKSKKIKKCTMALYWSIEDLQ